MIQLTLPNILAFADEAVAEKGSDYVYVNHNGEVAGKDSWVDCSNWHFDDELQKRVPGCIVGNILNRAGVSLDDMPQDDGSHDLLSRLLNCDVIEIDDEREREVRTFLGRAQELQDNGTPWGEAVEKAKEHIAYRI